MKTACNHCFDLENGDSTSRVFSVQREKDTFVVAIEEFEFTMIQ